MCRMALAMLRTLTPSDGRYEPGGQQRIVLQPFGTDLVGTLAGTERSIVVRQHRSMAQDVTRPVVNRLNLPAPV